MEGASQLIEAAVLEYQSTIYVSLRSTLDFSPYREQEPTAEYIFLVEKWMTVQWLIWRTIWIVEQFASKSTPCPCQDLVDDVDMLSQIFSLDAEAWTNDWD
jgi:hypothetical protein